MRHAALLLLLLLGNAPATPAGSVTGTVVALQKGKRVACDASYVFVYLKPTRPAHGKPPGDGQTFTIVQQGKQFAPHVTVVPRGSTVQFPNKDKGETHNVFWPTEPHWDLGRATPSDPVQSRVFDDEKEFSIYCDIHQQMWAKVKVVDTTYIAKVDKDGRYTIGNVAPGTYQVVAWAPSSDEVLSEKITVTDGQAATARELHLQLNPIDTQHTRKDGRPYCPGGYCP